MKKLLTILAVLTASALAAQTGAYKIFRKHAGVGDSARYVSPVNNSLWSLNANGMMSFIAQSNFANASHTHLSSAITDASTGGNGAADAGLLLKFSAEGQIRGSVQNSTTGAVVGESSGTGYAGYFNSAGAGETVKSINGSTGAALFATGTNGHGVDVESTFGIPLHVHSVDVGGTDPDIAEFAEGLSETVRLRVRSDGGLNWTGTGAQTTATALPAFGTSTKGVVPASGGGTTNFLRADGSWQPVAAGAAWGGITGTLTDQTDLVAALSSAQEPTAIIDVGSTNTTIDPGQNIMRFNSGTASSVTEISLSDVTSGSVDKGNLNSLFGGILQGRTVGTSTTFEYRITAAVHTSFTRYTVTYLKGSIPADNTVIAVRYIPEPATGGSGTVTSVAVSGSDGIEVDSGSPITSSGTIALGVNASTLKTHLSLGNVENTALSTWVGTTNITTLGNITSGTWNASRVGPTYGGTGINSYTLGDLLYADGTDNLAKLGGNTTTSRQFLAQTGNGSVSAAPEWRQINTSDVSGLGTLATQNGTFSGTHSGTSSGTNTGDQTSVSGNAGTATALQTARTINGTSFDGTANITVTAAAGTLTGSTLASGVTASSLTSVGTITTGVWNGTDVAVADGGTGSSTASGARTNLGATTVGGNLFTLTNPSAISYARINADNTVTARTMAQSRTDLALHPVTITAITGGTQASTSTSLADVTGSTITYPDTGWYEFEYFITHSAAATTTGAFYAVNTGGSMAQNYLSLCVSYDVLSTDKDTYCIDGFNSAISSTSSRSTGAVNRNRMQGTIHVTTAGSMVLRFATEVGSSAITITDLAGWYRNL